MDHERTRMIRSMIIPSLIILILWIIKLFEVIFNISLAEYGLYPLQIKGLPGIITSPLLHSDFSHLIANSIPLWLLCGLLFYFYRELAIKVLLLIYFITGIWVWFFARGDGVHIGASGVVYGLAAFLFLSGILRRESKLMAITLLITFLYGGMVWGVFPQFFPTQRISWESHLMGLLAGSVLALYYRKSGPQRKKYEWEYEDEDVDVDEEDNQDHHDPLNEDLDKFTSSTGNKELRYRYPENPE